MTTTVSSPSNARSLALAFLVTVACATTAIAQQPTSPTTQRDSVRADPMQQAMGMMNQMGPMYETMMQSMIDGTLKAMNKPENIDRMAAFTRQYYQALIKQGFTKEEALQIVAGAGIPALKMGR
jgi:hypothetical protein